MINKDLLKYLCCPKCKSGVLIKNNFLVCKTCLKKYDIIDRIPILINLKKIPDHLKKQIKYFEKDNKDNLTYKLAEWQKSYIRRLDENFKLRKKIKF